MAYLENDIRDFVLQLQKVHSTLLTDVNSNVVQDLITTLLNILNKGVGSPIIPNANPYNASNGDILLVDATNGLFTINPPTGSNSKITIKKIDSTANIVRISGVIDGDSGFDLTAKDETITIVTVDGTNWFII